MANLTGWLAVNAGPLLSATLLLCVLLLGLAVWTMLRMRRLERHYATLTTGTERGNLQAILEQHIGQVHAAIGQVQNLDAAVRKLELAAGDHVQHLGFMRFNPFRETGGDQSFVLALADGHGNGIVLSTLHSRDITRIYAKPLRNWESSYPLTDEEQEAIQRAQKRS